MNTPRYSVSLWTCVCLCLSLTLNDIAPSRTHTRELHRLAGCVIPGRVSRRRVDVSGTNSGPGAAESSAVQPAERRSVSFGPCDLKQARRRKFEQTRWSQERSHVFCRTVRRASAPRDPSEEAPWFGLPREFRLNEFLVFRICACK